MLSAIVAISDNNVIGKDNQIPWHLPNDLKRFKQLTLGKTVIMGSNTFRSIGALPNRNNIVITKEMVPGEIQNLTFLNNLEKIDDFIFSDEEFFVIGGAAIYTLLMPYVTKLYITRIYETFEGDTFFPYFNLEEWKLYSSEMGITDENNPYVYEYLTYQKLFNENLCKKNRLNGLSSCVSCYFTCNLQCPYYSSFNKR